MRPLVAAASAALVLAFAGAATAATIYSSGEGDGGGGPGLGANQWLAANLTFGSDAKITGIEGFLETGVSAGAFKVSIYKKFDDLGSNQLFSTTIVSEPKGFVGWQGATDLDWALAAGSYWISFEVDDPGGFNGWFAGRAPDPFNTFAFREVGVRPWLDAGSLALGIRISGEGGGPMDYSVSAVPEPATWAMMIVGFGAVGSMVRTSRRRNAFSAA